MAQYRRGLGGGPASTGIYGRRARDILVDEIEQGLLTPDKANPPTRALAQSLSQLMRVGLREAFLVGAIRQAMDQLVSIAGAEPANAWHRLADAMVPASVQIEFADD